MGKKSKNAGKKQSKTCNKPVSSYAKIHKTKNAIIKKFTTVNNYEELVLFTNGAGYGQKENIKKCPILNNTAIRHCGLF
tara:strand:- start:1389 stop:1625 length:237 start_codon:yes stop_codon:yes gene_type:complete